MYETVKVVNGYEIVREAGSDYYYVAVREGNCLKVFVTCNTVQAACAWAAKNKKGAKGIKAENARTPRETYSRLIGYNFGSDSNGNDRIYNGGYWDEETGKKQYEFLYYDREGHLVAHEITDYKGFRAIIDQYDWPKK